MELLNWDLNTVHGFSSHTIWFTRTTRHVHSLDHIEILNGFSYMAHASAPQHATIFLAARNLEIILIVCLTELLVY